MKNWFQIEDKLYLKSSKSFLLFLKLKLYYIRKKCEDYYSAPFTIKNNVIFAKISPDDVTIMTLSVHKHIIFTKI